jgi:hypothetical protein
MSKISMLVAFSVVALGQLPIDPGHAQTKPALERL